MGDMIEVNIISPGNRTNSS